MKNHPHKNFSYNFSVSFFSAKHMLVVCVILFLLTNCKKTKTEFVSFIPMIEKWADISKVPFKLSDTTLQGKKVKTIIVEKNSRNTFFCLDMSHYDLRKFSEIRIRLRKKNNSDPEPVSATLFKFKSTPDKINFFICEKQSITINKQWHSISFRFSRFYHTQIYFPYVFSTIYGLKDSPVYFSLISLDKTTKHTAVEVSSVSLLPKDSQFIFF